MWRIASVVLCLLLAVPLADGQAKTRKGKEQEPVISKKGTLIFEDDFSEDELLWTVAGGEWKILKKALVTKSVCNDALKGLCVSRRFVNTKDVIFQFKTMAPCGAGFDLRWGQKEQNQASPIAVFSMPAKNFRIGFYEGSRFQELAVHPLPYEKPRWLSVMFEIIGGKYALTVDGKTITYEFPTPEPEPKSLFFVYLNNRSPEIFAIDDVKVWEALPKDEGEEKDAKGKRKK